MKWRDIDWEFGIAVALYAVTGIMLGLALAGAAVWGVRQLGAKKSAEKVEQTDHKSTCRGQERGDLLSVPHI